MAKFQPGRSGNPGGRRKRSQAEVDLLVVLRRQLTEKRAEGLGTHAEGLVQALLVAAEAGDVGAIREVMSRLHGKPASAEPLQAVDLEGIAHRMQQRRAELEAEQLSGTASSSRATEKVGPPALPPPCGFRELAEPPPEPQAGPPLDRPYISWPGLDFFPRES